MREIPKPKILMLCGCRGLAASVLYCVRAAGYRPFVAGTADMRPLRFSRYVEKFIELDLFDYQDDVAAFSERLNALCHSHSIDLVMPGDYDSQEMLCRVRDTLNVAIFPMPSAEQFAELNDKWRFLQLCKELEIPIPKGLLLSDKGSVSLDDLEAELGFPMVVKPTGQGQSTGLVIAEDRQALKRDLLDKSEYSYSPLIAESMIRGKDISLAIFSLNGEVVRNTIHVRNGHEVVYVANRDFLDAACRIAKELNLNGVYDFDAILSESDGSIHLLECNARFWGTIAHAQWCGANFVETGITVALGRAPPENHDINGCFVRSPAHLLIQILRFKKAPWSLSKAEKTALWQGLGDPVVMVLRMLDNK